MGEINFHDFEVKSLDVDDLGSKVTVTFKGGIELRCSGVVAFRATNLGMQNVVSRVLDFSDVQLSEGDIDFWIDWVTSLSDDSGSWLELDRKATLKKSLLAGDMRLLVFEPSVGMEFACLCKGVAVSV